MSSDHPGAHQKSDIADKVLLIAAIYRDEIALRRWQLKPGSAVILDAAVNRLVAIANRSSHEVKPEQFREVGRKTTREELTKIADLAEALTTQIEALHAPAIMALADRGVTRTPAALRWVQSLVAAARAADLSNIPEIAGRGQPKGNLAIVVAANVISDVERLTGGNADRPADNLFTTSTRGLVPLIRKVFGVLEIGASPKAAYEAALAMREK